MLNQGDVHFLTTPFVTTTIDYSPDLVPTDPFLALFHVGILLYALVWDHFILFDGGRRLLERTRREEMTRRGRRCISRSIRLVGTIEAVISHTLDTAASPQHIVFIVFKDKKWTRTQFLESTLAMARIYEKSAFIKPVLYRDSAESIPQVEHQRWIVQDEAPAGSARLLRVWQRTGTIVR
ncbi:uncharacterized protein EV420DRAFT_1646388 [Desarmillaria tabescens]|uniref:Uncharacterized protein n=1 Tax=Armillaria tabescens TaxID=1929756 RepID=A0AA39JZS1_ARMTA|nr:uncharacterized protein EV420DRAFT_1646388 [Desarmillaria tabescens]KAK0450474.1 hypothetical protein EV420DRAFT_1646388 [Desarmillaria tabescens]